jgi:hypothetical protein
MTACSSHVIKWMMEHCPANITPTYDRALITSSMANSTVDECKLIYKLVSDMPTQVMTYALIASIMKCNVPVVDWIVALGLKHDWKTVILNCAECCTLAGIHLLLTHVSVDILECGGVTSEYITTYVRCMASDNNVIEYLVKYCDGR